MVSAIFTFLIYLFNSEDKINLVAIGDSIASGETSYNIDGISFNDYLKEYFESKKLLKTYNKSYSFEKYELADLKNDLNNNAVFKEDKLYIKQILHNADIITIAIGEEELTNLAMSKNLNLEDIKKYLFLYDEIIGIIKNISEAKIVIIGYYENVYLEKNKVIILNSELANMALKYNVIFINIIDLMTNNEYFLNKNDIYFNYKGHKMIANMIINSI